MPTDPPPPDSQLLLTTELLQLAKQGDQKALATLTARYLPRLQRWASGRLPAYARSLNDTADLVQDTLIKALEGLDRIEVRGPSGFQAYVRQTVLNRIRDQIRWARRRPGPDGVPEDLVAHSPSPHEMAVGSEVLDRYERSLAALSEEDQQILHLRIELDFDYEEIAAMANRPSAAAARMATLRALRRLAEGMGHER